MDSCRYRCCKLVAAVATLVLLACAAPVGAQVPTVSVQATDGAAAEAGGAPGTFTFTRSGATTAPLSVSYTLGGSATNSGDYEFIPGNLTFAVGQSVATRTVTPLPDAVVEGDESVVLTLTASGTYALAPPGSASVVIADDPAEVNVSTTDGAASEAGAAAGTFAFTRTGSTEVALAVQFSVGGSATNNGDYAFIAGSFVFPVGVSTMTRTVTPLPDALVEGDETVTVSLRPSGAYHVGASASATVTIADEAQVVTVAASDASAAEAGAEPATFTFTRSGSTAVALFVQFAFTGSAANNQDYAFIAGSFVFPIGERVMTRTVTPLPDAVVEGDEDVVVTLIPTDRYQIDGLGAATVTIADDAQVVHVGASDPNAAESGVNPGTFTFTRTGSTDVSLFVQYVLTGTAANNQDYAFITGSFTFAVGQRTFTRTVTPLVDGRDEGEETVVLTLSPSTSYAIGAPGAATVGISDVAPRVTIAATDPAAAEAGADPGLVTVTRTGGSAVPLDVVLAIDGTAENGVDYGAIVAGATIAAGATSVELPLVPHADGVAEGREGARFRLVPDAEYVLGAPAAALVRILDADTPIESFLCVRAKAAKGAGNALPKGVRVALEDDFASATFDVQKTVALCRPAAVGGEVQDPTPLASYQVKPSKLDPPQPKPRKQVAVEVRNALHPAGLVLDASKPERLLVPSALDGAIPPVAPDPLEATVEHFACWGVKTSKGSPKLAKGMRVAAADGAGQRRLYDVVKPRRLCLPAEQDGLAVIDTASHLLCYQVKLVKSVCAAGAPLNAGAACKAEADCGGVKGATGFCVKQAKRAASATFIANELASARLDAGQEEELCVPSLRP